MAKNCNCFKNLLGIKTNLIIYEEDIKYKYRFISNLLTGVPLYMEILNAIDMAQDNLLFELNPEKYDNEKPNSEHICLEYHDITERIGYLVNTYKAKYQKETEEALARQAIRAKLQAFPEMLNPGEHLEDAIEEELDYQNKTQIPDTSNPTPQPTQSSSNWPTEWEDEDNDKIEITSGWGTADTDDEDLGEEEEHQIDYFSNHHYRKTKEGEKLTFRTHLKGAPKPVERDLEVAKKAKRALRRYLKGKSTRARNTILRRYPELEEIYKK